MLGHAFVKMIANLRAQIGGMVEGADVLGSAASEIVASTAQLASGASESAAAVSETTTTVEEIRQTAQMASQKARAVSDSAQTAVQVSQSGRKSTEDVGGRHGPHPHADGGDRRQHGAAVGADARPSARSSPPSKISRRSRTCWP